MAAAAAGAGGKFGRHGPLDCLAGGGRGGAGAAAPATTAAKLWGLGDPLDAARDPLDAARVADRAAAPLMPASASPAFLLRDLAARCSKLSRDDLSAVPRAACCSAANFAASSALICVLAFCKDAGRPPVAFAAGFPKVSAIPTLPRAAGGPCSTSIGAVGGLEDLGTDSAMSAS